MDGVILGGCHEEDEERGGSRSPTPPPPILLPQIPLHPHLSSVEEDLSNGSSNEEEELPSNISKVSNDLQRSGVKAAVVPMAAAPPPQAHHPHQSHSHRNHSSSSHLKLPHSQFETPADETRGGTFPDDFDEELFIQTQIEGRNCPPGQFDDDDEVSLQSSFSTSTRKRKSFREELLLPVKKAATESSIGTNYLGLLPDPEDEEELPVEEFSLPSPPISESNPALGEWLNVFSGWNHTQRLAALNRLIEFCNSSEVRHMMDVIEPQFQRDFISLLPKELALYVLSFLEPKDLLQGAQTCRYWRILCDDSLLWKEKCREARVGPFSTISYRIPSRRCKRTNLGTLAGYRSCPAASDNNCITSCEPWKAAYLRQHNVESNWRFQPVRPAKTLKGHDDHVITCLQFSTNRIVSGSDDNTLKVWSATTGKCLRTLVGHTGGVWSSQMSGTTIVSGSTDRTLRVWNADTGACLHTLYGHTSTVRCMHLYEREVVSGSRDATLRVWNVDSGECLHVLVGHVAAVRCVQYNGKLVVSGAYDYMVRVWDVEREECIHQLTGHTNRVYSLQFDGIHVVSGSLDTSIRVWNVKTGACRHTLMGHQSLTSGMELRDNLLVSGNADSTVKIWDINTGQCLLTLSGPNKHLSAVTCLQLIDKFVITSSDDGTVKLWDIATGEFIRNLVTLSSGGSGGVVWRIRASETKLVCAVGSRNGTEETKLLVLDFDSDLPKQEMVPAPLTPRSAIP